MNDAQSRTSTGKALAIVIVVAFVTGVTVTLVEHFLLGKIMGAVTGAVVGAVTALVTITLVKKKSS